ncbi:MAG: hypothetical protein LBU92_02115 [Prevotellaceae bacterium]|nr:hypothetical protein [Prevotellaceae bacterium]
MSSHRTPSHKPKRAQRAIAILPQGNGSGMNFVGGVPAGRRRRKTKWCLSEASSFCLADKSVAGRREVKPRVFLLLFLTDKKSKGRVKDSDGKANLQ